MKYFLCICETLGQVTVFAVKTYNSEYARRLCYEVMCDCSGKWFVFETTEEDYQRYTYHKSYRTASINYKYREETHRQRGDVYIIATGRLCFKHLIKEREDASIYSEN